jgi:hypothetical protein
MSRKRSVGLRVLQATERDHVWWNKRDGLRRANKSATALGEARMDWPDDERMKESTIPLKEADLDWISADQQRSNTISGPG